jgi:ribonuclease-3
MGEKRGRPDHSSARQPSKKQKGDHSNGRYTQPAPTGNAKELLSEISAMPDPKKCKPCKTAKADLLSGTIALLDHLISEEAAADADKDILHHARALHKLLSLRARKSLPSKPKLDLDAKRPETVPAISIPPPELAGKLQRAKSMPPLPPITEPHLQAAVFTHSSSNDSKTLNVRGYRADEINYEKLEFLGDAYIEVIASRLLYSRFPDMEPSQQSRLRENLVKNETLGQFSAAYGLGDRLKHGAHVRESKSWTKILADVFEAYVAAIILSDPESGYSTAESWLAELWAAKLLEFKVKAVENPKARDELNKLIMAKGIKLDYRQERDMVVTSGLQKYFIGLYLTGWGFENEWLGSGEGQNKSQACVFAAMDALQNRRDIIDKANARKLEVYPPKAQEGDTNGAPAGAKNGK